ncbi:hypothetical protein GIB67_040395 [Kingdonia uniflora]|uniref:RNase H type-1 domain-containing protein n=1 Tax=Kingdonia uniflora TaxID=39325 RepID=A0A7J7KXT4_9MAGN|nr:hypothetical protein GIB67_040395 [Kingdonia uniflora]
MLTGEVVWRMREPDAEANVNKLKRRIIQDIKESSDLYKTTMFNTVNDLMYCDGASNVNPGIRGSGVVFRNNEDAVLGVLVKNLQQHTTDFYAECVAIVDGLPKAVDLGIENIWVISDSQSAIHAFNSDLIPWQLNTKCQRVSLFQKTRAHISLERTKIFSRLSCKERE